ncbi:MAG: cytochrome b [Gammaproteobacteria bacterium]|jgi:cytochrome b561|nr:cytochrome b [Gammaproteobacteria bacterium]
MSNAPGSFNRARRYLHWLVALLLVLQIPLAWIMIEQRLGPDKLANYALHKSLGITLLVLGLARISAALLTRRPPLPAELPRAQRVAARSAEGLLFLLLIVMPLTGWLMSSAANFPVSVFGWVTLPDLVQPDQALFAALQNVHRGLSYLLLLTAGIHLAAALRHYFVLRDNVVYSMLPFARLKRR